MVDHQGANLGAALAALRQRAFQALVISPKRYEKWRKERFVCELGITRGLIESARLRLGLRLRDFPSREEVLVGLATGRFTID